MYLVVSKDTSVVMNWGNEIVTASNGYIKLVDEKMLFIPDMVNVFEVDDVPSEISVIKYCYAEDKGFYINPNYIEPKEEKIYTLDEAAEILAQEVSQ